MKKLLIICSVLVGGIMFSQKENVKISIKEVQKEFKYKKYSKEILAKFVNQISEIEQKPTVTEYVPGEIIGWNNDRSTYTTEEIFWIKGNKLLPITTIPNDKQFFSQINKFASKGNIFDIYKWSSRVYEGKVLKKNPDGNFLINIGLSLYKKGENEDFNNSIGEYELEYKTKDFKKFVPIRFKEKDKSNAKWKIIR